MPVGGIPTPNALIVTQVIFGAPMRGVSEFLSSHVARHVEEQIGTANHIRILNRLAAEGWLSTRQVKEFTNGRPAATAYLRTETGWRNYATLRQQLSEFGITLTQ